MVRVLPIHFGVVLGCKGGGGKKQTKIRPPKVFSGAGIPNRVHRPDIPPRQGLKVDFGVVLGCKGGGWKKKLFWLRKVFSGFGRPKQGSTGKTSQGQPPRSDDLQ